ncbi:Pro-kumamolisin [Xylariomycetidae sp. FL0641]|nr:Pro-kumamolisin [Xylariomycetidae sp. FL0641]
MALRPSLSNLLGLILVLARLSLATALVQETTRHVLKESHPVPKGWRLAHRAPRDHLLTLRIGLAPATAGEVERSLDEISNPFHPRFRQYMSLEDVHQLVRPSDDTIAVVENWLGGCGLKDGDYTFSPGQDWIVIPNLSVASAEELLQTSYHVYWNGKRDLVRATAWSLPLHLHEVIEVVHPTTSFLAPEVPLRPREDPDTSNAASNSLNNAAEDIGDDGAAMVGIDLANPPMDLSPKQACNTSAITPICLRTLYGTLNYTAQAPDKNSMALANYLGEFNNRSDTRQYLATYRPEATSGADDFAIVEIAGAVNRQEPASQAQLNRGAGREGNLDAQVLLGLAYPTPLTTYSTGGTAPYDADPSLPAADNEPFLAWLEHMLAQAELPAVVSTSYAEPEYTVPAAYAARVCRGFAQLGARGVTVVFGSGDWGVGRPEQCHAKGEPDVARFVPLFPESCPYGTSVGATRGGITSAAAVAHNERNGFVSGGGFSDYFARPAYQDHAVAGYRARLGGLHDGLYNPGGRAYPDVAAAGYRIATVWNGTVRAVDGTSASAPIFAGVVALVNDALLAEGKPPLGFLNPWLYAGGGLGAFRDVTEGSTKGCNTSGFPALDGWDAASGFGTPWFPDFKAQALQSRFRFTKPWYMAGL